MEVKILQTGSKGNCAVVDDALIIDAGWNVTPEGEVVFLTHHHGDHTKYLNKMLGIPIYALQSTVDKLREDPRFAYTAFNIISEGVIPVIYVGSYEYHVIPVGVNHDAPCVGFDITRPHVTGD